MSTEKDDVLSTAINRLGGGQVELLSPPSLSSVQQVYRLYSTEKDYIVKVANANDAVKARLKSEAKAMQRAFQQAPSLVAEVFVYFEDINVLVLHHIEGITLFDQLKSSANYKDSHLKCAYIAGQWLGEFHRSAPQSDTNFAPRRILEKTDQKLDWSWPFASEMRRLYRILQEMASDVQGLAVQRVRAHSDFHPGNLILSNNGQAKCIDITGFRRQPIYHDISRYLIYAEWLTVVYDDDCAFEFKFRENLFETFLNAYQADLDKLFYFFHGVEILNVWKTQNSRGLWTDVRSRRVAALGEMAETFLPNK